MLSVAGALLVMLGVGASPDCLPGKYRLLQLSCTAEPGACSQQARRTRSRCRHISGACNPTTLLLEPELQHSGQHHHQPARLCQLQPAGGFSTAGRLHRGSQPALLQPGIPEHRRHPGLQLPGPGSQSAGVPCRAAAERLPAVHSGRQRSRWRTSGSAAAVLQPGGSTAAAVLQPVQPVRPAGCRIPVRAAAV